MYLQKIRDALTGYVKFRAEGYYIEKFINSCRSKGFYLGDLKREKNTIIEANIPVKNFKEICKIAKNNKCKLKILKKKGLPFFVNRYRKRKIFIISLFILIFSLIVLSKFIWNIDVIGNVDISSDEILNIVKSEGLEIGRLKSNIDTKQIVEKIRIERSDISWVRN